MEDGSARRRSDGQEPRWRERGSTRWLPCIRGGAAQFTISELTQLAVIAKPSLGV